MVRNFLRAGHRSRCCDWDDFAMEVYRRCEDVLASGVETLEELETFLIPRKAGITSLRLLFESRKADLVSHI